MRILLLLVSSFFSSALFACSCFASYQSLAASICAAQSSGQTVVEMRLNRTTNEGAFFTIERVLTGELTREEVFVFGGNDANCGIGIDRYPVNSRYLYFTGAELDSTAIGYTFQCGPARNLYELNGNKTSIRYMTPGENDWPGPREWQNYQQLLASADCELGIAANPGANPLKTVGLAANPGNGMIQLYALSDSFPDVQKMQVFDIAGRLVYSQPFDAQTPTQPYDLRHLPVGVYVVVISNQQFRRGLKYVKAR